MQALSEKRNVININEFNVYLATFLCMHLQLLSEFIN